MVRVRESKEKTDAGDTVTTIHYDVRECETVIAQSRPGERDSGSVSKMRTYRGFPLHTKRLCYFRPANVTVVLVGSISRYFPEQILGSIPCPTRTNCQVLYCLRSGSSAGSSVVSGTSAVLSVGALGPASRRGSAEKKSEGLRTVRWVKRQLLTRAPKTAEEIALDDKEVRSEDRRFFLVITIYLSVCLFCFRKVVIVWHLKQSSTDNTPPTSRLGISGRD